MNPIFAVQWMKEKRSPLMVIAFCVLGIIATLLFGSSHDAKLKIGVFPGQEVEQSVTKKWIELLNESGSIEFMLHNEATARAQVREGRADAAIQLLDSNYRIVTAIDNPSVQLVEQHVHHVFAKELQLRAAAEQMVRPAEFRAEVEKNLEKPVFAIQMNKPDGSELVNYNMPLQLLFTFTLFLAMFTVGFKINAITSERVSGIWNRMVLSPVSKLQMYMGHLMYSSLIGFVQITIVLLLFHYVLGFDLGDRHGMLFVIAALYTLAIVAFSILITGITRTPEQFNMIFPSVVPIMPLLSGGYMPPGTITNPVLLFISELFPIKHALDAMVGVAIHGAGWVDVFLPIAKLCMIGVICMGVGINLMERRKGAK